MAPTRALGDHSSAVDNWVIVNKCASGQSLGSDSQKQVLGAQDYYYYYHCCWALS